MIDMHFVSWVLSYVHNHVLGSGLPLMSLGDLIFLGVEEGTPLREGDRFYLTVGRQY
jgi:hypothetical protein